MEGLPAPYRNFLFHQIRVHPSVHFIFYRVWIALTRFGVVTLESFQITPSKVQSSSIIDWVLVQRVVICHFSYNGPCLEEARVFLLGSPTATSRALQCQSVDVRVSSRCCCSHVIFCFLHVYYQYLFSLGILVWVSVISGSVLCHHLSYAIKIIRR